MLSSYKPILCLIAIVLGCSTFSVSAQELLLDINQQVSGDGPFDLTRSGNNVFFVLDELWVTDGTDAGTHLVADVDSPEEAEDSPTFIVDLFAVNNKVIFRAFANASYVDVWVSDGTAGGTIPLTDFGKAKIREMLAFNNHFFFTVDFGNRTELWTTDGTPGGTRQIVDGGITSYQWISALTVARDSIFFQTGDRNLPSKLWKMDSTGQSLKALDIEMDRYMSLLGYASGLFYLYNFDEVTGGEPWVSDGTTAATRLLKDINPGSALSRPDFLAELGGKALLIAYDEMHGREPWISDGTSDGTFMLKDINPGPNSSRIWNFFVSGKRLFFNAEDGTHGRELWVSDGTPGGTRLVKDINPGEGDGYPEEFFSADGVVYFEASDGAHGSELWRSNGTKLGTWMVKDINPGGAHSGPHDFTPVDSGFLFSASDGVNGGALWFSDGSELGTVMIIDIVDNQTNSWGRPLHPMVFDNRLFFRADDGSSGSELWATRGSSGSTSLVADFVPGTGSSLPKPLGIVNNRMFVKVSDASSDDALWTLKEGSDDFQKIQGVGVRVNLGQRAAYDGIFVFSGRTDDYGDELWVSNGTPEGTRRVTDIAAGPASSATISIFGMIGDRIIFSANDGSTPGTCCSSYDLYSNRGQLGTTQLLYSRLNSNIPEASQVVNGKILFTNSSLQVYSTDGTPEGTGSLKFINHGGHIVGPGSYMNVGNSVFFTALEVSPKNTGLELWASDGTGIGTHLVKDINPGPDHSNPWNFFAAGDRLYFAAEDSTHGRELWISDGTEEGTTLVADINPGNASSDALPLLATSGYLFFSAKDGIHGRELWKTDGSTENTSLVADFYPGPEGSGPAEAAMMNGEIFVSLKHPVFGREYFKFDAPPEPPDTNQDENKPVDVSLPSTFSLSANYPNPFNTVTTITFSLPEETDLNLVVFDVLGRRVKMLASGFQRAGIHKVALDATDLATGIYFYELTSANFNKTRKMLLVKK